WFDFDINENVQHARRSVFSGAGVNCPLPGTNGCRCLILSVSWIPNPGCWGQYKPVAHKVAIAKNFRVQLAEVGGTPRMQVLAAANALCMSCNSETPVPQECVATLWPRSSSIRLTVMNSPSPANERGVRQPDVKAVVIIEQLPFAGGA